MRDRFRTARAIVKTARLALLCGAISVSSFGAAAGPAEDAGTDAAAIQRFLDAGKPKDGEIFARDALARAEAALGPDTLETANLYRLMGDTLFDQRDYAAAEPWFRKALAVRRARLGDSHADTARSVGDLAVTLKSLRKFDEAEPLYREAIDIRVRAFGAEHEEVATSWFRLARFHDGKGDYLKAAEILETAVAIGTKALGAEDPLVIGWEGERAAMLFDGGDTAAAEPAYRAVIARAERVLAPDDLYLATFRQGLSNLLRQSGRFGEAETLNRAALATRLAKLGPEHPAVASSLESLGRCMEQTDRPKEAFDAYSQALAIREKTAGAESPPVATMLTRVGVVELWLDRNIDAERSFRRLLDIEVKLHGPDSAQAGDAARWIANALKGQEREAEAEIFAKRALAISEVTYGPDHVITAYDLISLGLMFAGQQRFDEAEPMLVRALEVMDMSEATRKHAIAARTVLSFAKLSTNDFDTASAYAERALADSIELNGAEHSDTANMMLSLAFIRMYQNRPDEAQKLADEAGRIFEPLPVQSRAYIRTISLRGSIALKKNRAAEALGLFERVRDMLSQQYGPDNVELQSAFSDIGKAAFALGDYAEAVANLERSTAMIERIAEVNSQMAFTSRTGDIEDAAVARGAVFDHLVKAYDRLSPEGSADRAAAAEKAFLVAQRVIESEAATALAQMATRQAAGTGELAGLVRERQDLVDLWRAEDRKLTALLAVPPDKRDERRVEEVRDKLAAADRRIGDIDAALQSGFPDFAELQKPGALDFDAVRARLADDEVLLLYADTSSLGATDFETYLWAVPKDGPVRWIRLAPSTRQLSSDVRTLREMMGVGPQTRGAAAFGSGTTGDRSARVLAKAHQLYEATLAGVADMIAGKDLVIVPSKKLAGLPFHLMVSQTPAASDDAYRDAHWLALDHAITVLPSVAALDAAPAGDARVAGRTPYVGFANPLLTGRDGTDRSAFARSGCAPAREAETLVASAELPETQSLFRGAMADVDAVRSLAPLPETTDEACAVAETLGAAPEAVRLGKDATEAEAKRMSEDGELARARILHFATHGLVSGELSGLAEPAIVLTPPDEPTREDDGLLTASEVTTLKLNADWVILSACNTAAGDGGGEALSGLARAFFYAGARALMVSHWPVNSDAAVRLATGAIGEIAADPSVDRAEALRRAMVAEIKRGGRHADPANWAPFILVGASR